MMRALHGRDDARDKIYYDLVYAALSATAQKELSAMLSGYEYQSDFAKKYVAEGRVEGQANMLLKILRQRGFEPTEVEREEVLACRDTERLERWTERILQVRSVQDLLSD